MGDGSGYGGGKGRQGTTSPPTKVDGGWWMPQFHRWHENREWPVVQHREATMLIGSTHPALFRAFAKPGP